MPLTQGAVVVVIEKVELDVVRDVRVEVSELLLLVLLVVLFVKVVVVMELLDVVELLELDSARELSWATAKQGRSC